ncbi:type 1 fimbrial protein [Pseudomonas sp. ADAK18]|uniref:fimbrial protein n=1 Tax=Pseudomonas sp. ADAK18 TaxID=2730848 RepID=UPI0014647674|nr:fimbrial protein [Pseudomonas sp. ADAK18]QJI32786.1 type 1 fimbrial protein [Pseudomonas sp. ADAK18]
MFKCLLASSVICAFTNSAIAADGTINFSGEIIAASCVASAGAGTTVGGAAGQQIIDVALGKVSLDSLDSGSEAGIVGGTAINLNLDCGNTAAGLSTVSVNFDPMSGSGVDTHNNKLLKTVGGATGVGIGIYNADNTLLNLAGNESFDAPLIKSGEDASAKYTANLNLRAAYVANGEKLDVGTANGTLPFTLSYK